MSLASLIERYAAGPQILRKAVAGMSREQLVARPVAGKWSTLEVIAHLADFEIVYTDRLAAIVAENDPPLPGRDEVAYAARLAYQSRDLEEELRLMDACRGRMVRILQTLSDADLSRRGIHSEAGPLTLAQMLERIIGHIDHHVKFIHDKRKALGI